MQNYSRNTGVMRRALLLLALAAATLAMPTSTPTRKPQVTFSGVHDSVEPAVAYAGVAPAPAADHDTNRVPKAVFPTRQSIRAGPHLRRRTTTDNGIQYNGGALMTGTVNVYLIWYGTFVGNYGSVLTQLVQKLGGTPWANILTTYSVGAAHITSSIAYKKSVTVGYTHGTNLQIVDFIGIVTSAVTSGGLPSDTNGVYFVLTASDVTMSGFCTSFCGWHDYTTVGSSVLKYSFIGDASSQCPDSCIWSPGSTPNGNAGADGMANVLAHELAEAITDPYLDAWYDSVGYENADKCAWQFSGVYDTAGGVQANQRFGSMDYLVQDVWVNLDGGYCDHRWVAPFPVTRSRPYTRK